MVTIGVRKIAIKFQVADSKLSYNLLLGRLWIHDMDAVTSKVNGRLKFEFQGEVHTVLCDPKPYAFYNVTNFEEFTMTYPRYEIEPLEQSALGENIEKQNQIIETRMGTYKIENVNLFASIKDLGQPKILSMEGHQWYAFLT